MQIKFYINRRIILEGKTELLRKLLLGTSLSETWKDLIFKGQVGLSSIHMWVHNVSPVISHQIFLILNQFSKLLNIILNISIWGDEWSGGNI